MDVDIDLIGDGSTEDPYRPEIPEWQDWTGNGDGTATVTLSDEATRTAKSDAVKAANALNVGSAWADVEVVFGDDPLVPAIKKWLAVGADGDGPVKKAFSEFSDAVPQGFVVSYNDALWEATTATTAKPSTTSDDWTQIFSV